MYLIFDTETTGLPKNWSAPITDTDNWPRCIQIAWQLHDEFGNLIEHQDYLVKPEGFDIPYDSERIHGISTDLAMQKGIPLHDVLVKFNEALSRAKFVVGQNVGFDINVMGCEFYRMNMDSPMAKMPVLDTCTEVTANLLKIPGGRGGRFKLPTLTELHEFLFGVPFGEAHNATADVEATTRCFLELIRKGNFTKDEVQQPDSYFKEFQERNPESFKLIGLKHINLKKASDDIRKQLEKSNVFINEDDVITEEKLQAFQNATFAHLHNHTQFSVLQSTMDIGVMVKKSAKEKMSAIAMTDHGNMMGAFKFVSAIMDYNKSLAKANQVLIENGEEPKDKEIKPIVGCEFFMCENHLDKSRKDNGYQIVLLAKNKKGYHNLAKLASAASINGFYYVPRIDKELIMQYKEDLIALTGNLQGEVPNKILNLGEKQAEEALLWWKEQFQDDLYIEIMRHNQEDEDRVNKTLISFSRKHNVKLVATNNTYYLEKSDANAHDILLCVKDGEKQATPIGRGRGYRYGLPNQEYYYKTQEEMKSLFKDLPDAIINIQEVVDKIEIYSLYRDILLPNFDIPEEFVHQEDIADGGKRGENAFLRHLTYKGAERRYDVIDDVVTERLDFELKTIENSGYPGYFLIVQDFIAEARSMGVSVGPGRGSAAGSAVAYCLGITNLDPIKYDLLFERFLNPDRVSMPDIDIDFDDEGRSRVMDYVINKYGSKQVAQIITYGKMATKSSIKDAARVLDLPLFESERIAKLIPTMMPGKWNISRFLSESEDEIKKAVRSDEFDGIKELIHLANQGDLISETIQQAKIIEGSMRNTGIHACGVIITPDDITNFVPVQTAKDSDLYVTQFDNSVAESAGLLKMDFLGLKTLTLIKDTVALIKFRTGVVIDPEEIPIDDVKTYELFQRGETVGVFQYESPGMQKYMRELKPTVFADLIAMNALYRPGPLEYIPSFVRRKNGEEPITYDLDACEEYLKETYGITVYQEQVMLLSQKLAGFTKGEADVLRKAMGKKQKEVLDKMKPKFVEQASAKGHDAKMLEKIWKDWEAFASYAFNKSHSTCYAWIAYQTAYFKAHYPAEYMAAVLSNNMNDIKQVTFFMEECRRMGLAVLGPDVNESHYKFTVNDNYEIRFGIGAIKGVGEGAVNTIVENRKDGRYRSIFDLAKRIDLRAANKRAFENLVLAGGFDCFEETHRAQYFHTDGDAITFLEKAMKYGSKFQENENSSQVSLFGESSEVQIPEPVIPSCEEWTTMEKLAKEKEVVGIYISGHPLDDFKFEMKYFCNVNLEQLKDLNPLVGRNLSFGGMISNVQFRTSAKGKDWAMFSVEGYDESMEFRLFNEDFLKFRHFLLNNTFVYFKVMAKEGWVKKDTNERSEPRLQFMEMKLLNEVIPTYAKKLIINIDVNELKANQIEKIRMVLDEHQGNKPVTFEIYELEKIQKRIETEVVNKMLTDIDIDNIDSMESLEQMNVEPVLPEVEYKVINVLEMPSRNTRIEISSDLLEALEQIQVNFKLN
ncbi:DNA polymerase III subunit alpha [Paenimyroides tangerinum]|uniref:DNA polymerase III subunit alpha n=1 Tax=Paenimyroides tangerinum TaxID=2488728 RepID=A0A3P3W106_9FLAO|nr:DNA polymerase III subunit alpha [Paenimyroides tangerinum]RRJ87369.1 DNA polymerase III subunit alpha [Paenimyroides tangerinum]